MNRICQTIQYITQLLIYDKFISIQILMTILIWRL